MIETIDADDAWWPPTFTPDGVSRTRLAWWTIDVASHRTRSWTASSVASRSCVAVIGRIFAAGGPLDHWPGTRVRPVCHRARTPVRRRRLCADHPPREEAWPPPPRT